MTAYHVKLKKVRNSLNKLDEGQYTWQVEENTEKTIKFIASKLETRKTEGYQGADTTINYSVSSTGRASIRRLLLLPSCRDSFMQQYYGDQRDIREMRKGQIMCIAITLLSFCPFSVLSGLRVAIELVRFFVLL